MDEKDQSLSPTSPGNEDPEHRSPNVADQYQEGNSTHSQSDDSNESSKDGDTPGRESSISIESGNPEHDPERRPEESKRSANTAEGVLEPDGEKPDHTGSESKLKEAHEPLKREGPGHKPDEPEPGREKTHKRHEKSNIDRKHKKTKKQKVMKAAIKENYLDTMAEESEASGDEEEDEEEEDDDDSLLGTEIPDELKDFITDEVVEEVEEEEATDVEYEPDKLDEEDLELIAENTGSKWLDDDEDDLKRLRRLKKGTKKAEPEVYQDDLWYEDEGPSRAFELSDVWATVAECFGQVDLVIQILKNERTPLPPQMDQDSDYDPQDDPDYEKHGDLVEQVEKMKLAQAASQEEPKAEQGLEEYVDPDELAKEYLTREDEEIRQADEPERLYLRYRGRPRSVDARELQSEAQWMTRRLLNEFNIDLSKENVKKSYESTFEGTFASTHTSVATDVAEKCELLLGWFLNERWEVPFILYHKRHLVCPPLTDAIVWRAFQLDLEWVRLNALSEQVQRSIEKIGHEFLPTDILYFSTNFDYLDDLNDVNVHLTYHYPALYAEPPREPKASAAEEELSEPGEGHERELEYEDDIFGEFDPVEEPVHNASLPSSPEQPGAPAEGERNAEHESEPAGDNREGRPEGEVEELEDDFLEDFEQEPEGEVESEKESQEAPAAEPVDKEPGPEPRAEEPGKQGSDELFEQESSRSEVSEMDRDVDMLESDQEQREEGAEPEHEGEDRGAGREPEAHAQPRPEPRGPAREQAKLVMKKNSSIHLIETVERLGLHRICTNYVPTANELFKLLEQSVISTPNLEFRVEVENPHDNSESYRRLAEGAEPELDGVGYEIGGGAGPGRIEGDAELIQGNEEYQIEEFFAPFAAGPYTSGRRVFNALVDYYAKKYSSHISVRRMLREYYRSYCCLSCVTTPRGEEGVEVSDASWMVRRMCGMPLSRLTRNSQLTYAYPAHFPDRRDTLNYLNDRVRELRMVELYMHALKLERDGQVALTVHPLTRREQPYWRSDQYAKRFQQFYALHKDLASFVGGAGGAPQSGSLAAEQLRQMEAEKSLIEKELMILNDLYSRDLAFLANIQEELAKLLPRRRAGKASLWRYMGSLVLERMLNRELVPLFRREVREALYKSATASVLFNAQQFLRFKLDVPLVREPLACVLNDPEGANVYLAAVDATGAVLYLNVHRNLLTPPAANAPVGGQGSRAEWDAWTRQLLALANKHELSSVLVGLVDLNSLSLFYKLEELLAGRIEKSDGRGEGRLRLLKCDTQLPRLVATKYMQGRSAPGGSSAAGADQCFYLLMAVSACRFHQNTLLELANLWSDSGENHLLRVRLHPLQDLLPRDRLEQALGQVMLTAVNAAGVDLELVLDSNQGRRLSGAALGAIKGPQHRRESLEALELYVGMKRNVLSYASFLCGLGVRKAQALLDRLRTFVPSSRSSLTQVLGPLVFLNVASFIKFSANASTDSLDATRIHPVESGFIAEKLCNGSLDEQLSGEEAVQEIMSNPEKLDDLDLEAYSVLLNEKQDMPRMLPYLLFIKQELQSPYAPGRYSQRTDRKERAERRGEREMTNVEVFYSVLNLDRSAFKIGTNVLCKFEALHQRAARVTVLPLSLRGHVNDFQQFRGDLQKLAKDNPKYNNLAGEVFEGRVARIDFEPIPDGGSYNYRVDVSLTNYQKRHMLNAFLNKLVNQRLEEYLSPLAKYDINRSKLPINTQRKKIQYRRNIRHPAYKMWPLQKVVSYLKQAEVPVGESCICPMSEWDRLNLVIKTCNDPFNFATFVIYERNQRVPGELGKELLLQNEKYSNIDQIMAQFCETLKLNLEEFYTHPKFRHNCELNKVERDLIQESALKPDNINWAIIPPNPKRSQGVNHPLRFILVVIPPGFSVVSHEAKSLQDPIYVTHKSFKLWTHEEKSLRELISWWKQYGYWHRNLERTKYMQQKQSQYGSY